MEADNIETNSGFYNQDINLIYRQISIDDEMLFDVKEEKQFLIKMIETIYDEEFLMIESKLLYSDVNKLNNSFVILIKECLKPTNKYQVFHNIFIEYCDYFDLPYNKVYVSLHEKLQNLIRTSFVKSIGKEKFKKIKEKLQPNSDNILSLFDLVKQ